MGPAFLHWEMSQSPSMHLALPATLEWPLHFHYKIPVFPVELNGRACFMQLDSGAPHLFLNSNFFSASELTSGSAVMGVAGKVQSQRARVERLAIGDWTMGPFEAMALPEAHLNDFEGGPIAGTIGFRELLHFSWLVDYDAARLHLWRDFEPSAHAVRGQVRCQYRNHLPLVLAEIGGETFQLLLDTGCSDLVFDRAKQERVAGAVGMEGQEELVGAGGQTVAAEQGVLEGMSIGGIGLGEVKTVFSDLAGLQSRIGDFDGVIGHPLLAQVRTVVCWERKRLYFLD